MRILSGELPETNEWRVCVLIDPEQASKLALYLGLLFARAYKGRLIVAIDCLAESQTALAAASQRLDVVNRFCAESASGKLTISSLIVANVDINDFVRKSNVDLLLMHSDGGKTYPTSRLNCTVGVVRGTDEIENRVVDAGLRRVLVPTAGGPHAAHALGLFGQLPAMTEIEAFYVARAAGGEIEVAHGHDNLRKVIDYAEGGERIQSKLVSSDSIVDAIVGRANEGCDLVVIGATKESSIDRALFGDVVGGVVRRSKRPVMVIRQGRKRVENFFSALDWRIQRVLPRRSVHQRTDIYKRIRRSARPDVDFYILITLAAAIAALGLIANSPATVIGAMLVAPLMQPIMGAGMALVLGDARFLRLSLGGVLRGVALAFLMGVLMGFLPVNRELSGQIMVRTAPRLLDLFIALFAGLAGAYALCESDAAGAMPGVAISAALVPPLVASGLVLGNYFQLVFMGVDSSGRLGLAVGAFFLFVVNFVIIGSAAALVFLMMGFRPSPGRKDREAVRRRTTQITVASILLVLFVLISLAVNSQRIGLTRLVVEEALKQELGDEYEIVRLDVSREGIAWGGLDVVVVVQGKASVSAETVSDLREVVKIVLYDRFRSQPPFSLDFTHISAERYQLTE